MLFNWVCPELAQSEPSVIRQGSRRPLIFCVPLLTWGTMEVLSTWIYYKYGFSFKSLVWLGLKAEKGLIKMTCQGENSRNGVRPKHWHNKQEQNHYGSSQTVLEPKCCAPLKFYWRMVGELLKTISALFGVIIQHLAETSSRAQSHRHISSLSAEEQGDFSTP